MAAVVPAWGQSVLEGAPTVALEVSEDVCRQLVRHVPDVGVTYQPGVDARGNRVESADLGGGTNLNLPETFAIDLEIDLLDRFGLPTDPSAFNADVELGTVTVVNNRLFFNGEPLQSQAELLLEEACRRARQ